MLCADFSSYVGLPYKEQGRDLAGLDCWGLLRLVFREKANIVLPSYADAYVTAEDSEAIAALIAGHLEPWVNVDERDARPLDAILMRHGRDESHIGIVVRRGLLLHTGLYLGASRIEAYGSLRLRRRIVKFLRHEALA